MMWKSTDPIRIYTQLGRKTYYSSAKYGTYSANYTSSKVFQGMGDKVNYIKIRSPSISGPSGSTYKLCVWIEKDSDGTHIWDASVDLQLPVDEAEHEFNPDVVLDAGVDYRVVAAVYEDACGGTIAQESWPYGQDVFIQYNGENATTMVGKVSTEARAVIYEGSTQVAEYEAAGYADGAAGLAYFDVGALPEGAYLMVADGTGGTETREIYTGSYADLIDAAITSRASAGIEPKVDQVLADIEDPSTGLGAIQNHLDQQDQVSAEIRDSLGTPGSGEGSVHAKLGPYSGDSGDNNNIKDDIASLSVVGATVRDVWSYAPDGTEGSGTTADLIQRSTDASEAALSELQDSSHGLAELQSMEQDALDRMGDTAGTSLKDRLVEVMAELQSSTHGLDVLKAALDALQEDIGDPSSSGDTVEALIRSAIAELQDSSHGLVPIKAAVDDNSTALSGINGKLGAAGDDATAGTIWGDINSMQDSLAGVHGKLDTILAELQSSMHGLAVIKSALDQVLANQGDIDTYGSLTDQSQAIKSILMDTSSGLQAIKGQVDAVINVLGSPTLGTIAQDIADNQSRLIALQSDMATVLDDLQSIMDSLGNTGTDDIVERLQSISSRVATILDSLGTPTVAGASLHKKLGQDYDGVYTEVDGMLKTGHRVIDDLKVIMDTLITAQFPGSGQYLNTQGGYYANNQFYPVGTGPVVNEEGVPLGGVRVSAFMDRDGDGIFETLMARAYTDGSGRWQMALDTGVYLLTFYLPGALLVYEWRVVDPDGTGLEPPDEAPDGGHLPGGGVGLI